jgi:hypothetical protein
MRVSIHTADNIIVIDGKTLAVDCRTLRSREVAALQWYGQMGEVEFIGHKRQNEIIRSLKEFQDFIDRAQPIPEPEPPTPDELDAMHEGYMARHPNARAAWDERDAAMKREAEMRAAEIEKGRQALADHETAAKPLPPTPIAGATQVNPQLEPEKPKTKPKKK